MTITIRPERSGDEDVIHDLTQAAFDTAPYSQGNEGAIIRALRTDGDLTLSLVAEQDGEIVGHVAFSPVAINGHHGDWFGLGPISVRADRRKQGISRAMIRDGLARLKAEGAMGCALIGDPAVYAGSGFSADGQLSYEGVPDIYVQRVVFSGPSPRGALTYAPGFSAVGQG